MFKYLPLFLSLLAFGSKDIILPNEKPINTQLPETDQISIPLLLNYQGKITDNIGNPVRDSSYSVTFRLFNVPSGGTAFWNETQIIQTRAGLFHTLLGSVNPIPSLPLDGNLYLEMQVNPNPAMTPRVRITSSAYSYIARRSDSTNYLNQMGASTGQVLKWNGTTWAPGNDEVGGDNAWVRGTPDSVLYTIRQLGIARGGSNNMLYGSYRYTHTNLGFACTTGTNGQHYSYCTVAGGYRNMGSGAFATIAGGSSNKASGEASTIGGGVANVASDFSATVSGGYLNIANGEYATIGGGYQDTVNSAYGFIGGGGSNTIAAASHHSTIGGGEENRISAIYSTIGGGYYNSISGNYSTVGGGFLNTASGIHSTVGGGYRDSAIGKFSGVFSGQHNSAGDDANDSFAVIVGGWGNSVNNKFSFIGGGRSNRISGYYAVIGGGSGNLAYNFATVSGGFGDTAMGEYSTIGGGSGNKTVGNLSTIGGGYRNSTSLSGSTVAGGLENSAANACASIGGGSNNLADAYATVPGGYADTALAFYSFATGNRSVVLTTYSNSAAFNGQAATASNQLRCGTLSKAGGSFTIDHPLDPYNKILNHYFIEGPEMLNIYRGSVVLDASGKAEVRLPDYFSALNRNPHIQLTGVGSSDVYVAEDIKGNTFVIGGKPGTKVYWLVTGERQDVSAEAIRRLMPVEQPKTGELKGRMLDDDFLVGCMEQLEREGKASGIDFRTTEGRKRYEDMKRRPEEIEKGIERRRKGE